MLWPGHWSHSLTAHLCLLLFWQLHPAPPPLPPRRGHWTWPPYSISTTATTIGQRKALPCTHPWGWKDTLFLVVQSLSRVQLFVTPWTAALQTFPVSYHLLEFAQVHVHCICYLYTNTKTIMKSFWVCSDHQHQLHSWPGNIFLRGPVCFDLALLPPRHPPNSCTAVVLGF